MKTKLYDFYHSLFALVINCEHVIGEIEYWSQYGNWPVSFAIWLQYRRIQLARLTIKALNILPEKWLTTRPPSAKYNKPDVEIPF